MQDDTIRNRKNADTADAVVRTNPIQVKAHQTGFMYTDHYKSLADMWTEWHKQYVDADYPRIMIRFEDTLVHAEELMHIISECSGAPMLPGPMKYFAEEARHFGGRGSLLTSLMKLGRYDDLYRNLVSRDKEYVKTALDPDLMRIFKYKPIDAYPGKQAEGAHPHRPLAIPGDGGGVRRGFPMKRRGG